jgi:hypothetical protein
MTMLTIQIESGLGVAMYKSTFLFSAPLGKGRREVAASHSLYQEREATTRWFPLTETVTTFPIIQSR